MQEINELHHKAMALADLAEAAKRAGCTDEHIVLTREALRHESEAAWKVAGEISLEPSRSVLFRSAATLAMESGDIRVAEQLIAAALAGNPPAEIADELRDLLEDVYFHRHLKVRGITLAPDEFQMTLEGNAVGFGIARSEVFVQRVKDLETLLYRTAERRLGRAFREAGRRMKDLAQSLELYLSVPRAASFAVTLRLGKSTQLELPGMVDFSADTMKELLAGIEMINDGNLVALEESIPDESYRHNFIGLVERLSPDGDDIRIVGFTAGAHQEERIVALTTPRKVLRERLRKGTHTPQLQTEPVHVEIRGVLLEADATKQKEGVIEVVDSGGIAHKIAVPRGLMSDIVKPMFEEEVVVIGIRKGDRLDLQTIDLAESEPGPD
ncbi:MAG: hypothetical protein V1800_08135 [Candidatus Latescibacterota bacterium]